jgi:hypothetical protein
MGLIGLRNPAVVAQSQAVAQAQTATPTTLDHSSSISGFLVTYNWKVRNLDATTATVWSELNNTAPTANARSLASNGTSTNISVSAEFGAVLYARAEASGKTMSALHSFDAW